MSSLEWATEMQILGWGVIIFKSAHDSFCFELFFNSWKKKWFFCWSILAGCALFYFELKLYFFPAQLQNVVSLIWSLISYYLLCIERCLLGQITSEILG